MFCTFGRYVLKGCTNKSALGHQILVKHSTNTKTSRNLASTLNQSRNFLQPRYGQPTAATHPHLVREGELLPGIPLEDFKKRRNSLMEKVLKDAFLAKISTNHILIIPSASKVYMSEKIPYVFRQNTDFLYFTGCQEPDSVLVMTSKGDNCSSILFVRKKDSHSELWDGPRTGIEAALGMFGVDQALPTSEFESYVKSFLQENKNTIVWYDNTEIIQPELQTKLHIFLSQSTKQVFDSLKTFMHEIRLIKTQPEIELMQKSCEIASTAIANTIEVSKPGVTEHQIFATVDYECRMNGAEYLAYPPVVAGGNNANIIHYITNNQIVNNGDMVLMDAGCEYHGYSSDITRTWPINGTFTPQQRILYEIVLDTQKELITKLREMPTLDYIFHQMCFLMGQRLQDVGLVPKAFVQDKLIAAAYSYCPHHASHYLGMDVHDTGRISRAIKLQPGMIVTIEPGIYVNARNKLAPAEFHGMGIRIEDDILITNNGPVILTRHCPKEIAEIEALANKNQC
ncbi:xaa-Pro aminopeptidase 3-like [Neodiprion virginianus]|uniref:xaa-Pro aminopeptidase 3-like n=1 Tax=Neodiprion fabricii TaxID=2872261 RepID=UPI001ED9530B|nr:xaa-Pro aminopeptidase 3-like [Neodiprion fabricii]XP_046610380.1 xaa-Pro aminopeptidase 3-like [Neodiprion virginianus]